MRAPVLKSRRLQVTSKAALRISSIALGISLLLGASTGYAADDDDEPEGKSFERGVLDNVMSSIGGKRIEDGTINYRERSPLVIPSKTDLPPPTSGRAKLAPNWPKDPDEAERKRAREEAGKKAQSPEDARMPLLPSEMAAKSPRGSRNKDTSAGSSNNSSDSSYMMSPSQLGYSGGLFSNMFGSSSKPETSAFTGEPDRGELTEPPKGYQTPSPNFAYGVGPAKGLETVCDSASGQCEKREKR